MSNEQKKDMRGIFSPNSNKNKPAHPDFTGKVVVKGEEFRVAIWENKSADGKVYYSMILSTPTENNTPNSKPKTETQAPKQNTHTSDSIDDELKDILKITDEDNPFGDA